MKYYICSPVGRTGSKRIVFGINETINKKERIFISPGGLSDENGPVFHGFKLYTSHSSSSASSNYTDSQAIQIMDAWETPVTVHSHNVNVLPTDPTDWKFILSSRKRKIDTVFSGVLASKTGSYDPSTTIEKDFQPFETDLDTVNLWMEDFVNRENIFFDKILQLTGQLPTVIYLEDTWQTIQEKVGLEFKSDAQDTSTKSKHKPIDYITNYDEILSWYEERLQDYQLRFPTETI